MKDQINHEIQNSGRYLQSLDSVRFAESDSKALIIQARVELLISLLFGETIPIGEHQFLDSDGFIPNAVGLIESLKTIDDPRDRRKVESIFPFRVGIRESLMPVDNFIALKLGDLNYQLSHWNKLNQMTETRLLIKKKHEEGNFVFDDLYKLLPDQYMEIDELKKIRDRFRNGGKDGSFSTYYKTPTIAIAPYVPLLPSGLEEITKLNESTLYKEIEQQQELKANGFETNAYIDSELLNPSIELISLLKELKKANLPFGNRTNIRKDKEISRRIVPEDNKFGALLEIFDSLYNSAAAKAVGSYAEEVSSARDFDDKYIRAGTALVELAKSRITTPSTSNIGKPSLRENLHWTINTNFSVLYKSIEELVLYKIPWEIIWQAYLDTGWKQSLSELNKSYAIWDNIQKSPISNIDDFESAQLALDDAISAHVSNISRLLKGSILNIQKDDHTGDIVIRISTYATAAGIFAGSFIYNRLGITLTSPEIVDMIALIPPVLGEIAVHYLPNIKAWNTAGRIQKIFREIYTPK